MAIPIVNEMDEIIGSKERADLDYASDIFRSVGLWITNDSGDILLAQRSENARIDPNKWGESVGGTVEDIDSYEETVIREAQEELGLENITVALGPKQFINSEYKCFIQWFVANVNKSIDSFVIQQEEVQQIAWIPKSQLEKELQENPEKYVTGFYEMLKVLS